MTLVAALRRDNAPIVVADLVVSHQGVPKPDVGVPTGATAESVPVSSDGTVLAGLAQKLMLVGDHLAVAFAGSGGVATEIALALKERFGNANVSLSALNEFFSTLDAAYLARVSVVGAHYDAENNVIGTFGLGALRADTSSVQTIHIAGSGEHDLKSLLGRMEQMVAAGEVSRGGMAISTGLCICGALLGEEVSNGEGLKKFYGGAYEIAFFDGRRFQKLSNILNVFVPVEIAIPGEFALADRILAVKQDYSEGELYLRALELGQAQGAIKVLREDWHAVRALDDSGPARGHLQQSLQADWQVVNFITTVKGKPIGVFVGLQHGSTGPIEFDETDPTTLHMRLNLQWFGERLMSLRRALVGRPG
ncbi:hypothetical protein [Caulobacter sp. 17J65-9]|uniref:hypothetical protein n=1 Tax=Caulobacter sp. 17J65-9 TaxID=2709382 RepID=UPI0013C5A8D4|nr:hypothetical protein [Caulobacter sp. 17J65-9]NEX92560.1 hypothetical protein [Caulobacter sp. 17J65-9]